jgi:hypothetical protein
MEGSVEQKETFDLPLPLNPKNLTMGDPFLKRMLNIHVSPILFGTSIAILFTIIRMIAAWWSSNLRTSGMTIGFFEDPGMYINLLAGFLVWTYYFWMPRGISQTFHDLLANKAIGRARSLAKEERGKSYSIDSFLLRLQTSFSKWVWSASAIFLSVLGTLFFLLPRYLDRLQTQDSWSMANPLNLALSVLWAIAGLYAALLILLFILLSIYWLRRLFTDFAIEVRPLHPDQAGGLSALGKFSLNLSYVITVLGFILATIPISRHYLANGTFGFSWTGDVILGLGIYIIAAPFAFFAPLSVAHTAMKGTKQKLLLEISRRFEDEYAAIQESIQGDMTKLEENMGNLRELHSLHELTCKFPVWPFNIENILRFITSFVSPILLVVFSSIIRSLM